MGHRRVHHDTVKVTKLTKCKRVGDGFVVEMLRLTDGWIFLGTTINVSLNGTTGGMREEVSHEKGLQIMLTVDSFCKQDEVWQDIILTLWRRYIRVEESKFYKGTIMFLENIQCVFFHWCKNRRLVHSRGFTAELCMLGWQRTFITVLSFGVTAKVGDVVYIRYWSTYRYKYHILGLL